MSRRERDKDIDVYLNVLHIYVITASLFQFLGLPCHDSEIERVVNRMIPYVWLQI